MEPPPLQRVLGPEGGLKQALDEAGGAPAWILLQRAWEGLGSSRPAKRPRASAGAGISTPLALGLVSEGGLGICAAVQRMAWERLHCGPWRDVAPVWRRLYAIGGVLQSAYLFREGRFNDALRGLDLVLMMGGAEARRDVPIMDLVAVVESRLRGTARAAATDRAAASDGGLTIPPCPTTTPHAGPLPRAAHLRRPIARVSLPSLEEFRDRYMAQGVPVIITGGMEHWPCMGGADGTGARRWTLPYLRTVAGLRHVPVELGSSYLEEGWSQGVMRLADFIDHHVMQRPQIASGPVAGGCMPERWSSDAGGGEEGKERSGKGDTPQRYSAKRSTAYLAQYELFDQIPQLQRDIMVPDYCVLSAPCARQTLEQLTAQAVAAPKQGDCDDGDEDGDDDDVLINAWFGPSGTVSPLHHDPCHNLLSQVVGAKYIRLYHPDHSASLYPSPGLLSNTSLVDAEEPDLAAFPAFGAAPFLECELRQGEMLYIPPGHWHFVKALSVSFSVSFWWGRRYQGTDRRKS